MFGCWILREIHWGKWKGRGSQLDKLRFFERFPSFFPFPLHTPANIHDPTRPNKMECIKPKEIDELMTKLKIFFPICLLLPSSHEIVICAYDDETKAGKEVHVPNQACTYRKSYWGSRSKEVCRDEEDGKCSVRISSSAYLLPLALISRVCCSNFLLVGVLKSSTTGSFS